MRHNNTILYYSRFVIISLLSLYSCVKTEYIIEDGRIYNQYNDLELRDGKYIVYFNPRLESNFTRSLSTFPVNCQAQIYAFVNSSDNQFMSSPIYETLKAGILTPVSSPMVLPIGSYNFYGISSKIDSTPPSFDDNYAYDLSNGVDYLWCGVEDQSIGSNGSTIDLTFTHSASQLVFNILNSEGGSGLKSISLASFDVPPVQDSLYKWSLTTGEINQIHIAPTDAISMTVNDYVLSGICMPYRSDSASVVVVLGVNSEGTSVYLTFSAPMPSSGYLSGHSYNYDVIYNADSIIVGRVFVKPWIEEIQDTVTVN